MAEVQHILVVVDPTAASQPALARAAWVAGRMGWRLELLICTHEGMPTRPADSRAACRALLEHQLGYLKELARGFPGQEIVTKSVWDRPLHEAIIRETLRCEAQLVMKDAHTHSAISRALITNTDWHLIRDCPGLLWLVRDAAWAREPVVAAFVDPLHEHDEPAELDHRILREARSLALGLDGVAHAVHCYEPTAPAAAPGATALPVAGWAAAGTRVGREAGRASRFNEIAAAQGIASSRVHLRRGPAAREIPAAARDLHADLVVMGAVSRSRLQRAIIGNTAEKVLERLPCDVLVVKPARFDSPVTYRAQPADFMEVQ